MLAAPYILGSVGGYHIPLMVLPLVGRCVYYRWLYSVVEYTSDLEGRNETMATAQRVSVADCIGATEDSLQDLVESGAKTQEDLDRLSESLDMSFDEWHSLQNLKSVYAGNGIASEAAQEVFRLLGSGPDHVNGLSLASKIVLTQVHKSLLEKTI